MIPSPFRLHPFNESRELFLKGSYPFAILKKRHFYCLIKTEQEISSSLWVLMILTLPACLGECLEFQCSFNTVSFSCPTQPTSKQLGGQGWVIMWGACVLVNKSVSCTPLLALGKMRPGGKACTGASVGVLTVPCLPAEEKIVSAEITQSQRELP